jgi:hypothetical protein
MNNVFEFGKTKGREVTEYEKLPRTAKAAYDVLETQPGANFAEGSYWQAFNAVTYLTDHELGRSADTRLQSAWYGVNQQRKVRAMNLALEMAGAA